MSTRTYSDVTLSALPSLPRGTRLIDVRERIEFDGALGHLPGSELVPLGILPMVSEAWPRDTPLLLICRSGARSAQAAQFLARRGFRQLFNLAGGMLAVDPAQLRAAS